MLVVCLELPLRYQGSLRRMQLQHSVISTAIEQFFSEFNVRKDSTWGHVPICTSPFKTQRYS